MTETYKKCPITEALCEFQLLPKDQWDFTVPGLIYQKVEKKFPIKQQQIGIAMEVRPTKKGFEHKVEPSSPRAQFYKKDKKALIQIAPHLFVVNQLKPYKSWKEFRSLILRNFSVYRDVAQPHGFKRIGLRYVNRINFEEKKIDLEEFFSFYPSLPAQLPQDYRSFISRVEISYSDDRDRLLITIASTQPEKPNTISIVLDIDYIMNKPEGIALDVLTEWIETAHSTIKTTFEACITEKCKDMLRG